MIKPLWDYVLVQVEEAKEVTQSGFYITQGAKEVPPRGEILAVGPDVSLLKAGDKVVFARYAAIALDEDITNDDAGQRLIKQNSIFGVIDA